VSPSPASAGAFGGASAVSFNREESILESYRSFTGEKTPDTLRNLFSRKNHVFLQEPAIVIADGTTRVRVSIRVFGQREQLPRFLVSGGTCLDVQKKNNSLWVLDIVPNKGSMASSVTVLSGNTMVEYPLVVAPPLNLVDAKNADPVVMEYVTIANELASVGENPSQK